MKISKTAKSIGFSPTLQVFEMASKKRAAGIKLYDFGVGEPQLPTPDAIAAVGREAIRKGFTKYTANPGTLELRKAVDLYLQGTRDLRKFGADEILISNGAKQSVYLALAALCDPGDEVLIPLPAYPSYAEMARLLGAVPVFIEPDENSLKITTEALEKAITDKTKMFILNQPSNPSGRAYSRSELQDLAMPLKTHGLAVVSDEIYSDIMCENSSFVSLLEAAPELEDQHLLVSGVSKSFAMTGWRIGFSAGPSEWIGAMNRIQNHLSGHASSISQYAAVEAFRNYRDHIVGLQESFRERRTVCRAELARIPDLSWVEPEGAFYYFVDVRKLLPASGHNGELLYSSRDLCLYLLDEYDLVMVPGEAFDFNGYLRISFTADREQIKAGLQIFREALEALGEL